MIQVFRTFVNHCRTRVEAKHLIHGSTVMVVDWGAFPHALMHAFFLTCPEICSLDDDREALHQEDSAHDWQQQLLMDDDCRHCDPG